MMFYGCEKFLQMVALTGIDPMINLKLGYSRPMTFLIPTKRSIPERRQTDGDICVFNSLVQGPVTQEFLHSTMTGMEPMVRHYLR